MKVSIIIPTKDKFNRLRIVLKALEGQLYDNFETILVLDGCNKETIDNIKLLKLNFSSKIIINDKNIGRAKARNLGINESTGNLIIFIDDDRVPDKNFINNHVIYHKKNKCAVIGLKKYLYYTDKELENIFNKNIIINDFNKFSINSRKEKIDQIRHIILLLNPRSNLRWISFHSGNLSVRKEDLIKAGLFDENFLGWGYEDIELGYRLKNIGLKFINSFTAVNYHLYHPINEISKFKEEKENYKYFINKIKEDSFNKLILKIWWLRRESLYKKKIKLLIN